jgi:hypothetical protein
LFFRVGGAAVGKADVCLKVNSNDVIGDHFWVWRADHGEGVGWTVNTTKNGVIINGNYVTFYGLFVEHFHEYQTLWNGNNGKVYFYQSEIPYDVPSQAGWMNGTTNGWASYKVGSAVTNHELYGSGVYSFFRDSVTKLESGIEVPNAIGVRVYHAASVWLAGMVGSEITHVVNNKGAAAVSGNMRQTLTEYSYSVEQPVMTPATGTYYGARNLTITTATAGATIRYTLDGTTPTATTGTIYTGPIPLALGTKTIKAIAYKSGMLDSAVTTETVTITDSIAFGKTAASSSVAGSNTADKAIDGNSNTRWESASSDPQWITVDLGAKYDLRGVKIVWYGGSTYAKDFKVQVSDNNSTWTDAYSVTNLTLSSPYTSDITFTTAAAGRYVRIYGTKRVGSYGYSIREFEVYRK